MIKRKFSSKVAPVTVAPSTPNTYDDKPQSPSFSPPPSPCIERRPPLPARTEAELRAACAYILQEFKPSTQLYDEIVKSGYLEELDKTNHKPSKPQPSFLAKLKRRPSDTALDVYKPQGAPEPPKYVHVPTNAARDFEQNAASRQASVGRCRGSEDVLDPLTPAGTLSAFGQQDGSEKGKAAARITRPKTTTRAESYDNSTSTTNTNTTFDDRQSQSTGVTTLPSTSHTPGLTPHPRASDQVLNDRLTATRADSAAKDWMALEFARRQRRLEDEQRQQEQQQRPPSRAGSIRSISSGIREYIRPQSSKDSLRSAYSRDEASSTKDANGGSSGSRWLGSLRRRGSFSSWKSGSGKDADVESTTPAEAVDLNRALPPLPGLDQYKEEEQPKKKTPNHIAHLMRASSGYSTKSSEPQVSSPGLSITRSSGPIARIVDEDGLVRTLSQEEEIEREAELRRAVQEKMRLGSIDGTPPVSRGTDAVRGKVRPIAEEEIRKQPNVRTSEAQVNERRNFGEGEKKVGALRRTFSRLTFGSMMGGRKSKTDRKGFGKVVEVQTES
ncbi:MAG: hypothetical protein M1812_007663 [Candelaria pacifica]|nr:MAG: hypothetical protein M1812_007663 [Candelaria pacifica]